MTTAKRVLFICQHNSARSQMAEAFLNELSQRQYEAHSAGLEPTAVNPLAAAVMAEVGIDISGKSTQSVFDLFKDGRLFEYVITVCDAEVDQKCPIFPGVTERLLWPFPDPATLQGTEEEKLEEARAIRDSIRAQIESFLAKA